MIRDATSWTHWTDVAQRADLHWQVAIHNQPSAEPLHRLLGPRGKLIAIGTHQSIMERWCELTRLDSEQQLDNPKPIVLILHGLGRTRRSMTPLLTALQTRLPNIEMQQFAYASMINRIDDHAQALAQYIAWSLGSRPVIFVAHSLGNIVLRRMFRIAQEQSAQLLPTSPALELNARGHAMLGPPNQGSLIAKRFNLMPGVSWIMGPSFLEVGTHWNTLSNTLALPPCPTAILAGDVPSLRKAHPLLPAPNDGLVLVDEARLSPDQEIEIYPILHSLFMYDQRVYDSLTKHIQQWLPPA